MKKEKCRFAPEILEADSRRNNKGPKQEICFVVNETAMQVSLHCPYLHKGDESCGWTENKCKKIETFQGNGFEVFECEESFLHYMELEEENQVSISSEK